ncbi:MAG: hypothetical protein IT380_09595 [Myxococcales bacterium]|nr:hypothetical protein [Myxococcales bacterium]
MRRLVLLSVLVSRLALAGWASLPAISGAPQDLVVVDGGVVVAASLSEAVARGTDGGLIAQLTGSFVGAGLFSGNCLAALSSATASVSISAGCGTGGMGAGTPRRFRVFSNGLSVARVSQGMDGLLVAPLPTGTFLSPTGLVPWSALIPRSLQAATINGADVAILNETAARLQLSVDGGAPFPIPLQAPARDAVPFARLGAGAAVVVSSAGAVGLVPVLGQADVAVILPMGFTAQFVAMSTDGAGDAGTGYGLITSTTGAVLSPVPDPSEPGSVWILRSGAPPMTDRVHCFDARWCAGFGAGGVIHLLSNDFAPVLDLDAGALLPGVPSAVTASASDQDGDPVFITWSSATAQITPGADPEGRAATLLVPAGQECTSATVPLTLTISDGLGEHDRTVVAMVPLASTAGASILPLAPVVDPGDPPVAFTAGSDGGCAGATFMWSTSDGQSGAGPTFNWNVPATACSADGGTAQVSVAWRDPAGHQANASTTVTVTPWGRPNAPQFPAPAVQSAGTTQVWSPLDGGHACSTTSTFPGLELDWMLSVPPAGVTLTPVDGGLEVASSDVCTRATLTATAQFRVAGASAAQASGPGTLTVDLVPSPPALGPSTPFAINLEVDAGVAMGFFTVDAGCRDLALLSAEVSLGVPDASVVAQQTFPTVPGPWSLPIPASCGAGQFELVARLLDDGGVTGAEVRDLVPADTLPVLPGVAAPSTLPVTCGVGGRGQLTVASNPNGCATPLATWRQTGGPALTQSTLAGTTVEVQTVSTGFDVVGERLSFDVEVSDGAGASASGPHEVLLTAAPFVKISESLSPFPAREEEPGVVTVRLENTSTCDVSGLTVREVLTHLVPVIDSVRASGPLEAEWGAGTLTLRGVSLAAGATETITFKVRRQLLSRPEAVGSVLLRDQLVSIRPEVPPTSTGCGCHGGGESLLGLSVLLLLLRRRGGLRGSRRLV